MFIVIHGSDSCEQYYVFLFCENKYNKFKAVWITVVLIQSINFDFRAMIKRNKLEPILDYHCCIVGVAYTTSLSISHLK